MGRALYGEEIVKAKSNEASSSHYVSFTPGANMNQGDVFNDAVTIVRSTLSPESAKILQFSINNNQREPTGMGDLGFGVAIRNLLAEHGILWEEVVMYSIWFAILQEAIRTLLE